jgi:hypothetical protein
MIIRTHRVRSEMKQPSSSSIVIRTHDGKDQDEKSLGTGVV